MTEKVCMFVCISSWRIYHIVEMFWGRKASQISRFYSHPWKFSPQNFRHTTPIYEISLAFGESFLCKCSLPTNPWNFFPSEVCCYTVSSPLAIKSIIDKYSLILILIIHDLIITGVFQNLLPGLPSSVQSQTFRGVISFLSHVLDIDVPLLVSSTNPAQGTRDSTASSTKTATCTSTDIATSVDTVTTIDAAMCSDASPYGATVSTLYVYIWRPVELLDTTYDTPCTLG